MASASIRQMRRALDRAVEPDQRFVGHAHDQKRCHIRHTVNGEASGGALGGPAVPRIIGGGRGVAEEIGGGGEAAGRWPLAEGE